MAHRRLGRQSTFSKLDKDSGKYLPLYGTWLVDMAMLLGWHRPSSRRRWPDIFEDNDFCAMTGMKPIEDRIATDDDDEYDYEEGTESVVTASRCRKLLLKHRTALRKKKLSQQLPLFNNIGLLATLLDLSKADRAILTFAAGLSIFPQLRNAISPHNESTSTPSFCKLFARVSDIDEQEIILSLSLSGPLVTTGLIKVNRNVCDLEDKVTTMTGLEDILLQNHAGTDDLMDRFLRRVPASSLGLDDFPHLKNDSNLLQHYLSSSISEKTAGVNILIHGKPGVGKNEFVQVLADSIQATLYEVFYSDKNGDPIKGEARLRAYALCQRFLARSQNSLLLFDEVEDVFGGGGLSFFSMLFSNDDDQTDGVGNGKAWINRTMENNPVPAIWISNKINQIDKAYLRRFDYSVSFPIPPHSVRVSMARHHLDLFDPPQNWIERLASNEEITPGQYERAAKVARIGSKGDNLRALELVENVINRSTSLLGQRRTPSRNIIRTGYSLKWLNTDVPILSLVEGVKRRPKGTFCFYGAAGTGKSELARYMADQVGKQLVIKRASDILSPWIGVAEQNIAAMFDQARQQDAVLVLDEADSFLSDRRDAQRSWEVTQVNELLTQMEAYEGIFVCTTNLMSKLDQASLRRFAFKVRFDPLKPDQRLSMFRQELIRLGGDESECINWNSQVLMLEQLTPGDFAVAARQFELLDEAASAGRLYEILKKECVTKGGVSRKIGFGG